MIESPYFEKFQDDSADKQIRIEFDGGVITNEDFDGQNFELTESLCSESELRFGCCEASSIKIKVHNIFTPLKDKWLTISTIIKGMSEPFSIGRYKVFSDTPTADRKYREVVAYDAMYEIIGADVAEWYNKILPDKDSTVTLKQFRESFTGNFGLEEVVPDGGLINDNMTVEKTIEPSEISGKDVITAICEINGCFGHIGRDGKFHYIYLQQMIQGLYPANDLFPDHAPDYLPYQQKTGHLYPQNPKGQEIGKGLYISCQYEDFVTKNIEKLQIRQEENDIGCICGAGDNCYIIQDNFLVYGKSAEELNQIAANIYGKITNVAYRPIKTLDLKGNPCFEVGDPIRLNTKYDMIESYIMKRTLKGIQALRDNFSANGVLKYGEKANSVAKSIMQLKGKTNTLTRTVEENRLEMLNIVDGLSNVITVTAKGIQAEIAKEAARASEEEEKLHNNIQITAEGLQANIDKEVTRAEGEEAKLSNSIKVTAEEIKTEVFKTYETKDSAEKTRETLQSSITQNAESIELKVTKGDVSSEISQELGKIKISADRFSLDSTNCKITEDGIISASKAEISGKIIANSGEIGLFTIDETGHWLEYYKDKTHVCGLGATAAIYAGSTNSMSAPFYVTYDGYMHAEEGEIAGWKLTSSGFLGSDTQLGSTLISPNGNLRLFNFDTSDSYLIVEMRPGNIRMDVGENGSITLGGATFSYADFEKLKEIIERG